MRVQLAVAASPGEGLRCQYFIADHYHRAFGIQFSEDMHDLAARIEPYPHRYLMALHEGELVATMGLYTHHTYAERYGGITDADLRARLDEAGLPSEGALLTRELTKFVVRPDLTRLGLGRALHDAAFSRDFLAPSPEGRVLVLACARRSIFDAMHQPGGVVRSRFIAWFPRYPIHEGYRMEADPMETRVVIPELDVPLELRAQRLPLTLDLQPPGSEA